MNKKYVAVILTPLALSLSACGDNWGQRAVTGGGIGAGAGLAVGALVGWPLIGTALVGGIAGAGIGAAITPAAIIGPRIVGASIPPVWLVECPSITVIARTVSVRVAVVGHRRGAGRKLRGDRLRDTDLVADQTDGQDDDHREECSCESHVISPRTVE